jgi:cyclic-di-GMP phosphodiesterase, flagellum assembly factor TipF
MIRISTIFVATCMVLVSASLGLILYSLAGISGSQSALVALTALTFLILYNAVAMRLRDRSDVGIQIADLSRGTGDLARQIAEFGRRLSAIEGRMSSSNSAGSDRLQGMINEINELGGLVKQLANSVAQHEDMLVPQESITQDQSSDVDEALLLIPENEHPAPVTEAAPIRAPQTKTYDSKIPDTRASETKTLDTRSRDARASEVRSHENRAPQVRAPEFRVPEFRTPEVRPGARALEMRVQDSKQDVRAPEISFPELRIPDLRTTEIRTTEIRATEVRPPASAASSLVAAPQRGQSQLLASIKNAIDENRVDIYLQPLVTLPQRKVRFYEAVTRLRDERDQMLAAENFIGVAEAGGLMGRIDQMVMHRCVQVLRRLMVRNKDVGIFCNVSQATLGNPAIFAQCLDYLEANRALASSFVLEFKQSALRNLGPLEIENLAALAQRGYRFSIDHVTDLRFEPRDLADRGVRFIKVPAALLLDPKQSSASDIHPSDLSDLLGRFGIDLIAERIEGERAVVDLLDYDVRFGQGFLFAPPRPLRPEGASATGGASAASGASALPNGGQDHKIQDSKTQDFPSAGKTTPEAASINPSHRAIGNAALARRATGNI